MRVFIRNQKLKIILSLILIISCAEVESNRKDDESVIKKYSSISLTKPIDIGDIDCPNGGIIVESGIDENGNGILDETEVDNIEKVCNGVNGISILWQGNLATAPVSPELNWAYYNTTDGISYIWDGTSWQILSQDGSSGANGISILWQGNLATAPVSPELNWAYYNTTEKITCIWNGQYWETLIATETSGSCGPEMPQNIFIADEEIILSGGKITNWGIFYQPDTSHQPTLISNILNGHAVINFDDSFNQYLNFEPYDLFADGNNYTLIYVAKFMYNGEDYILGNDSDSFTDHIGHKGDSAYWGGNGLDISVNTSTGAMPSFQQGGFNFYALRLDESLGQDFFINDTKTSFPGIHNPYVGTNGYLGTFLTGTGEGCGAYCGFNGQLATLRVYQGVISDTEINNIRCELSTYYALAQPSCP